MYEFDPVLKRLEGKMPWTVFYIPFSAQDEFGTNGRVLVRTEIDGYEYEGVLLPSRNGHYLVFNKQLQKKLQKKLGNTIHVKLEKITEKNELTIPKYIHKKLETEKLLSKFNNLPNYIKKEEITKITSAKKEETKLRRLDKLINKLT